VQNRELITENGITYSPMPIVGDTENRGTEVHFMADVTIFGNVEYHYDILAKRMREVLFGLPSLMAWQWIEGRRIFLRVRKRNER